MGLENKITWLLPKEIAGKSPRDYKSAKRIFCAHSGSSMYPTLSKRDLLETTPYQNKKPKVGDVILFLPPEEKNYFIHRIVNIGPKGFLTRGDNNSDIDAWALQEEDIYGRVIAAHQGERSRRIYAGLPGRLSGICCLARRKTNALIVKLLGPVYRWFCTGGILCRLIPVSLTTQVLKFQSDSIVSHRLLLGKRVIGTYDKSSLQWRIRRPYRVLVDESSLPTPQ